MSTRFVIYRQFTRFVVIFFYKEVINMSEFGNRLKKLRESKDMSQVDLAARLQVSPSAVGMYEQGLREPNIERLTQMADIFGVSLDYLMCRTNDKSTTFSNMTRDLIDLLHLPDEEILKIRVAEIDGKPVSKEDFKNFIIQVRLRRQLESSLSDQIPE